MLIAVTAAGTADAQMFGAPGTQPSEPTPDPIHGPYMGKLMLVDAASVGTVLLGAASESGPLALVGATGWFLGPPIVHLTQGEGERAVSSLVLRLTMPMVGAFVAHQIVEDDEPCSDDFCDEGVGGEFFVGLLAGGVVATAVDHFMQSSGTPDRDVAAASWAPTVTPTRGGATAGIVGRF